MYDGHKYSFSNSLQDKSTIKEEKIKNTEMGFF